MFKRKVAIVTAASKGIGAACSELLAAKGCHLVIMSRSSACQHLAERLGAEAVQGDISDERASEEVVAKALSKYGRIDYVINNAGYAPDEELLNVTHQQWHNSFDLLFMSVVHMARLVTPTFERQGEGSIVNISSIFAREPSAEFPISSVVRGALTNFTKLYADRFASKGLRMNCILPGFTDTSRVWGLEYLKDIPMRRSATPTEIASAACFLLSDEARYITGQSICVDGGLLRAP